MPILNFESIIIELEQLLAHPSPSKPLVRDVGNELFDHPETFAENVERSKRGGVIRGVYYDRLDGIAPEGVGHNSLKNICFTQIFEWIKQAKKAKLQRMMRQQKRYEEEGEEGEEEEEEDRKEGWEERVGMSEEDDDDVCESDEESNRVRRRGALERGPQGKTRRREKKEKKERKEEEGEEDVYRRFEEVMVESLPWELREIIEEYSRTIERNYLHKLARKEKRAKEEQLRLGGKVYIRNLAGKMTMIEGVEPNMTIWQMKELLDAKTGTHHSHHSPVPPLSRLLCARPYPVHESMSTGMVPYTVQLFYHQVLDDRRTVAEYNIREGSVVYIVLAWGGG